MVSLSARGRVVSASAKSRCAVALPPRGPKVFTTQLNQTLNTVDKL
jgi:hypothetical protein